MPSPWQTESAPVMVPIARIAHQSTGRVRLRFLSHRKDALLFGRLKQSLSDHFTSCRIEANAETGSVLIVGQSIDPTRLARFGNEQNLFALESMLPPGEALAADVYRPLQNASRRIDKISGGNLDLPGLVFVALLLFGAVELIRGNFKSPPWYTAFWYAFGMFSTSIFNRRAD